MYKETPKRLSSFHTSFCKDGDASTATPRTFFLHHIETYVSQVYRTFQEDELHPKIDLFLCKLAGDNPTACNPQCIANALNCKVSDSGKVVQE
jgi:hypothetical protein